MRLGAWAALAMLALGCAEERPPINRVQALALSKAFFVGEDLKGPEDDPEFLWRNYVVDGSISQSLLGVGSWSTVERLRWEITEDMLVARKAYQIIKGGDDKGLPDSIPDGTIVAAFKIESHFDIRRAYNPTTGEEMNVVEENTVDRPWSEREYMRVDFTQNIVDTPLWLSMFVGKVFGEIKVAPATYQITDPSHPDAPRFEPESGYFDITTKYSVEPEESSWIPGIPTCHIVGFFTGSASYDCNYQEATVRSSFVKVDPNDDFERLEITTAPGDVVGNPASIDVTGLTVGLAPPGEQGWDPGYGFTDELYHRFAHIHDIWKKSHLDATCASNLDVDNDGTADECHPGAIGYAGNMGSQCDVFAGRCTIPYRDREIATVGYWVNDHMPDFLLDPVDEAGNPTARGASEDVIHSWNQLLQNAVARARETECRRAGQSREECETQFFNPDSVMLSYGAWLIPSAKDPTPVLTLCHNPVRAYDHEVCGAEGDRARLGDIRKNFLAYWPYASRAPWGGIGNWGADPLTGQIHGAAAMIMGRSVTHAAAWQRDVIQVAIGDLTIEDIADGEPAANYAHLLTDGRTPEALSHEEMHARVDAIDAAHAEQSVMPAPVSGATIGDKLTAFVDMQKTSAPDASLLDTAQLEFNALAEPLRGSVYEAQLVDGQWMTSVAGLSPDASMTDALLDGVSPLRGMDPGQLRRLESAIGNLLEARGVCFHDKAPAFGSVDLQGMARYFAAKYPDGEYDAETRGEAIYQELVVEAYKGIAVHEVGHSLGLLHNFASSYDSANYRPQYWQLRTHEGSSTASCGGSPRTGDLKDAAADDCMGPRYLDPETDDEMGMAHEPRPGIQYYAQTSVMEYPNERFGETTGLGQYDAHAMKALYGRVLETFEGPERGGFAPSEQMAFAPRLESQLTEMDRVVRSSAPFEGQTFAKPTHYTELARMMKVFDPSRCRDATESEKVTAAWRLVHGKVCAPAPRDHAAWSDFEHGLTQPDVPSSLAPYLSTRADAPTGGDMVRWYYRYGATNNSYFHTQLSDGGADPYETTVSAIQKFDMNYPWTYFRRKNREFFYEALPFAASQRFFERIRAYHWNAANRNAFYRSFGEANWEEIAGSDDWHRPLLMAETEMFNALARSILTPEPGTYGQLPEQPVGTTQPIFDAGAQSGFQIEIADGRYIGDEFNSDPDAGGSWNYLHWMRHAGFGVEKTFAAMALADGRPVLSTITRENYLDGRDVRINFRSDMPAAMDRLIGGVLAEDWETIGMWIPSQTSTVPRMLALTEEEPTRPNGARVLFPNVGYRQQLGVLIFAHLYSRQNSDMALSDKLRLWIDGSSEAVTVPDAQQVRFYHPESGYTYIARRYGEDVIDGKVVDRGIASRMLEHANLLVRASYKVAVDEEGALMIDPYGAPVLELDENGFPIPLPDGRIGELTKYVGLLNAARQVSTVLGNGPLGGP